MESHSVVQTLSGHSNDVSSVAYSFDGKYIASASEDSTVKIWKLRNLTE
ncbi:MAG: WD40 domain-containing protein [Melioribacteraceae bacterium]|nr:WD40 domain-containing protein [Melioribacteraceae bacterium]MCF8263154.1 WD40 domain-containing protein [Melioribacteraceae bacterium]MCF8430384.1 WD40 domain-containing protein [Melioribacteraceae bacterium]